MRVDKPGYDQLALGVDRARDLPALQFRHRLTAFDRLANS